MQYPLEFTRKNPYRAKNYSIYLYSPGSRGTAKKPKNKALDFMWFFRISTAHDMNQAMQYCAALPATSLLDQIKHIEIAPEKRNLSFQF